MNPRLKKIYKDISARYDIPVDKVEEVVKHQFKFVSDVMAEGDKNKPETFKTVQLTHIGKFALRDYKLKEYKEKADGRRTKD